jgi:hypothetical protein
MKISLCTALNASTTLLMFIGIAILNKIGNGNMWQFGASDDLFILSVPINTNWKYYLMIFMICLIKIVEVIVNDFGSPDIYFSIFDPSCDKIYGFSMKQLLLFKIIQTLSNEFGNIFKFVILVTRFDIAIISIIAQEITSTISTYIILSSKKFYPHIDKSEDIDIEMDSF